MILTVPQFAVVGAVFVVTYYTLRSIHRLYFHPLSSFPGPKLGIITSAYAMYWNMWLDGSELFQLQKLHDKYGPIVRIAHDQLHIRDIDAYNEIFKIGTKFTKVLDFYEHPLLSKSLLCIIDPKEARLRRDAYNSYFSKSAVRSLESSIIRPNIAKFLNRMGNVASGVEKGLFNTSRGFRCLTADIITQYSYSKSFGALDHPDFNPDFLKGFEAATDTVWPALYFHHTMDLVMSLAFQLPRAWLVVVSPVLAYILEFQDDLRAQVMKLKSNHEKGIDEDVTIFKKMLDNDPKTGRLAADEKTLTDEAFLTISAGMDTTGHTLTVATYNLIRHPDVQARLLKELKTVLPESDSEIDGDTLEKLPYLTAVIKESLRCAHGVPGGLPRKVPPTGATLSGRVIPGGTTVHNSAYIYHTNPQIFPDPEKFDPERWLFEDKERDQYLVPFSRGSRICIGMNLAWSELFLVLGHVIRRYELSFPGTGEEADELMKWTDHFLPITKGMLEVGVKERVE